MAKHDLLQIKVLLNCRYVSVCYRYEYKGKVCHFCVLCILMHPARVHSVFCYCFSYCVTVCTHRTCSSFIILVWTSSSNIESLCFQLIILSLFTHNPMEQNVTAALPYNVSSWWTLLSQNNVVSGFENTLRKHLDSPISCYTCYTLMLHLHLLLMLHSHFLLWSCLESLDGHWYPCVVLVFVFVQGLSHTCLNKLCALYSNIATYISMSCITISFMLVLYFICLSNLCVY